MAAVKQCLLQVREEGGRYKILLSFGYLGEKNNQGPYAKPFQCFFKERKSVELMAETRFPEEHFRLATDYLRKAGFGVVDIGYDADSSFHTEEPGHFEVFMGQAAKVKKQDVAYTKNIATCLGIGFYSKRTGKGSLFHIPGAEDSSVAILDKAAEDEAKRLGRGINVHFVSGLATMCDEVLNEIYSARKNVKKILGKNKNNFGEVDMTLCDRVGEYIKNFSLDCGTGLFSAEKDIIPYEKLVEMDAKYRE